MGDMAQVFLLNLHEIEELDYRQCYEAVSKERKQRADRYKKPEDALRCVMAEVLVRYVYRQIRNQPELPEFVYPRYGKPYVANDREFHFSVSHTGMLVAVGYAKEEIGIDIEQIHRPLDRKSIAALVFTPEEQAYVLENQTENASFFTEKTKDRWEQSEGKLRFTQLWTAKESYLKYLGYGFRKSPLSFFVNLNDYTISEQETGKVPNITIFGSHLPKDYYITVCGTEKKLSLEWIAYHSIQDVILSNVS